MTKLFSQQIIACFCVVKIQCSNFSWLKYKRKPEHDFVHFCDILRHYLMIFFYCCQHILLMSYFFSRRKEWVQGTEVSPDKESVGQ